jgi:hypothetical protein
VAAQGATGRPRAQRGKEGEELRAGLAGEAGAVLSAQEEQRAPGARGENWGGGEALQVEGGLGLGLNSQ